MSMSSGGQFAIWFILLLQELKFPIDYPAAILGDNTAAIQTHYSPGTTKYARHIDLRSKFVARMLKKRDYVIAYILVGTLERLFQECKMREKALTSKQKQQKQNGAR